MVKPAAIVVQAVGNHKKWHLQHHIVARNLIEHLLGNCHGGCFIFNNNGRTQRAVVDHSVAPPQSIVQPDSDLIPHHKRRIAHTDKPCGEMLPHPLFGSEDNPLPAQRVEDLSAFLPLPELQRRRRKIKRNFSYKHNFTKDSQILCKFTTYFRITKMAATTSPTFPALRQQIAKGNLAPVYLLHGEEGYYIDRLVEDFENLIPEADRDFNLYTLYAPESGVDTVMDICRRYPMMSERQVVIVKEAQAIRADQLNKLHHYAEHPTPTTVLVISCRGAEAKGKDLIAAVKKSGVIFESKKLSERNIVPAISDLVAERRLNIDNKALMMLRDYIGTDLSRLYNEIDKLALILGAGAMITPEAIERNIGISKDYNNFELIDAINARNSLKIFRITDYFRSNPKNNPTVMTVSALFNHFSNLLVYHYTKDKSPSGYLDALGFRNAWQLRPYEAAARAFNVRQTIEIISAIRRFDAASKGIGSRQNEYDLLHDLMFHIITARGVITI